MRTNTEDFERFLKRQRALNILWLMSENPKLKGNKSFIGTEMNHIHDNNVKEVWYECGGHEALFIV